MIFPSEYGYDISASRLLVVQIFEEDTVKSEKANQLICLFYGTESLYLLNAHASGFGSWNVAKIWICQGVFYTALAIRIVSV